MPIATLIGDVRQARRAADRDQVHQRLTRALLEVNQSFKPVTPLRITVGDEYQGGFARIHDAVRATLRLRLALAPDVEVRHGIGWGDVQVLQDDPRVEDGPGWWAARDAIEAAAEAEARPGTRHRRTVFRRADGHEAPDPATLEAMLILRDELLGGLSERSMLVLRGLLAGRTQRDLAEELGVTASAVSQRVRADGLAALVAADEELGAR
ncbi:SatD family protein [Nocardioides sp.]|uniref:SatD family protein n=1 Tax=Nocardioides sp. TaxID=35761 RepID=UPI002ED491E0